MSNESGRSSANPAGAESLVAFLRLLARCIEEEADSLEADPASMSDLMELYRAELVRWGLRTVLIEMGGSGAEN